MGSKAKHRYSQAEEDLIWAHYTPEELEQYEKYIWGYSEFTENKRTIDSLRNKAIQRKVQNDNRA